MTHFLLSSRKAVHVRRKFGRSSLPVHPAEFGTGAGISKPTAYKQNLTHLKQITKVPSVVSSHIPGPSVRSWYWKFLRKWVNFFLGGGGGDTFRLLFKYVRVWSLNFLFAIPQTYRGRSQAIGTTNSVAKLFPQSVDTFSCCSHSCHVVFVGVLWMPVRTVDTAVICSTHISEVVVFLKKTVTVILSVPTLHHKVILEPRRSASFTAFVSAFVACSVCCELPHICKWNQRLV